MTIDNRSKLRLLGWDEHFEREFNAVGNIECCPYRVARVEKETWVLWGSEKPLNGYLTGKLRFNSKESGQLPALGDWVTAKKTDPGSAQIEAVLPRKTTLSRKVAGLITEEQVISANVDYMFIVTAPDQDFSPGRIERYLALVSNSGIKPVLVINKADLDKDTTMLEELVKGIDETLPLHYTSALSSTGLEGLLPYISSGETVTLVGSSGVGKSSLINALNDSSSLKTGAIREKDQKGRHTTNHREMIVLPQGGIIIDNPGMREIQLWVDNDGIEAAFPDIEELILKCRFRNCSHRSEPGCAVIGAIKRGELPEKRWNNYNKMLREVKFLEERKKKKNTYSQVKKGR